MFFPLLSQEKRRKAKKKRKRKNDFVWGERGVFEEK